MEKKEVSKKSDGTPIKHSEQICQLIYVIMLP